MVPQVFSTSIMQNNPASFARGDSNNSINLTGVYIKQGSIALRETPPLIIYENGEWYDTELIFNVG